MKQVTLSELLKEWRAVRGFTQIQAAHHFHVPLRTWEGWERSEFTQRELVLIAIILRNEEDPRPTA